MFLRTALPAVLASIFLVSAAGAQHFAPPPAVRGVPLRAPDVVDAPTHANVPTEQYSHGDPTGEEQYVLELINRARATPREEGVRLIKTNDAGIRSAFNFFNVDTARVRADFATYPVRQPLAFNASLITAARRHANDMLRGNFQSHVGSDGSNPQQRGNEAGYSGGVGENIFAYAQNLWYGHVAFNVDWGNAVTLHRQNIMNYTDEFIYTEFGAGVIDTKRPQEQGKVGPMIIVQNFGLASSGPFLTGVVYNDANSNGFYDVGEGLEGVEVMPSAGTYYAVTSSSGGYAIPVRSAGSNFTVTFSKGPLASSHTREVSVVDGQSVKLDLAPTVAPGPVVSVRPLAGAALVTDTVRFQWRRPMPNVDRYRLQVSRDSLMTSFIINDSTMTDTASVRTGFQNGLTYYWRVQAHNGAGWGEFGAVQSFRIVRLPAAVTLVSPADNGLVLQSEPRFVWHKPAGPITSYEFEIAHDQAMTNIRFRDTTVVDTSITLASIELDRYFWRVRAKNESGWGPYSETRTVQSAVAGIETDDAHVSNRSLIRSIFPNPTAYGTTVTIELRLAGLYTFDLIDQLGRIVGMDPIAGTVEYTPGTYTVPLSVASIAPGYYFLRLNSATGESTMHRLVVTGR